MVVAVVPIFQYVHDSLAHLRVAYHPDYAVKDVLSAAPKMPDFCPQVEPDFWPPVEQKPQAECLARQG